MAGWLCTMTSGHTSVLLHGYSALTCKWTQSEPQAMLHIHCWPVTSVSYRVNSNAGTSSAMSAKVCACSAKVKAAGQLGALSPPWKLIQAHPGFEPGLMDTLLLDSESILLTARAMRLPSVFASSVLRYMTLTQHSTEHACHVPSIQGTVGWCVMRVLAAPAVCLAAQQH